MTWRQAHSGKTVFTEEVVEHELAVLLDCRTVLEKNDYVSTGMMTYAEGDMLEIEIGDYQVYSLGDLVKVTVYTPLGIFIFHSTIIAKDHGALIVINPPENRKKFVENREYTRIVVDGSGYIRESFPLQSLEAKQYPIPLKFELKNISICGIGFTLQEEYQLEKGVKMDVFLQCGIDIPVIVQIVRSEELDSGWYFGARIMEIAPQQVISYRAFILKSQVESHAKLKKTEVRKRFS